MMGENKTTADKAKPSSSGSLFKRLVRCRRIDIKYYLTLFQGKARVLQGFCPLCNSDAPEIDACPICNSYRSIDTGEFPPSKHLTSKWLSEYKSAIKLKRHTMKMVAYSRNKPKLKIYLKTFLLRKTYSLWHPLLVSIMIFAKENGTISNQQMYILLSYFDQTQEKHYMMEKKLKQRLGI